MHDEKQTRPSRESESAVEARLSVPPQHMGRARVPAMRQEVDRMLGRHLVEAQRREQLRRQSRY